MFRRKNISPLYSIIIIITLTAAFLHTLWRINQRITFPEDSYILIETAPESLNNPAIKNTASVLFSLIRHATNTIDIETSYITASMTKLAGLLLNKANHGCRVRIVLADNTAARQGIAALGIGGQKNISVYYKNIAPLGTRSYGALHCKLCIIDSAHVLVGSANYSIPGMYNNREMNLYCNNSNFVRIFVTLFNADCNNEHDQIADMFGTIDSSASIPSIPMQNRWLILETAPDKWNSMAIPDQEKILPLLLARATNNIVMALYDFTAGTGTLPIQNALITAAARGVSVKLLLDKNALYTHGNRNPKQTLLRPLQEAGIDLRSINLSQSAIAGPACMHAKYIVIDNYLLWLSTGNITYSSLYENREYGVVLIDRTNAYYAHTVFTQDWKSEYSHRIMTNQKDAILNIQ